MGRDDPAKLERGMAVRRERAVLVRERRHHPGAPVRGHGHRDQAQGAQRAHSVRDCPGAVGRRRARRVPRLLPHDQRHRHGHAAAGRLRRGERAHRHERLRRQLPHPARRHRLHARRRPEGHLPRQLHPLCRRARRARRLRLPRLHLQLPPGEPAGGVRPPHGRRQRRARLLRRCRPRRPGMRPRPRQLQGLLPHHAQLRRPRLRHHQHSRQLRHRLRRQRVLDERDRGPAVVDAQGVPAGRAGVVRGALLAGHVAGSRRAGSGPPAHGGGGGQGPRPSGHRHGAHGQGRLRPAPHHALHGRDVRRLGRVGGRVLALHLRHLPHLHQPRRHRQADPPRVQGRRARLWLPHGRPRRRPQPRRRLARLDVPRHGRAHRLCRHPHRPAAPLEQGQRRRRHARRRRRLRPRRRRLAHDRQGAVRARRPGYHRPERAHAGREPGVHPGGRRRARRVQPDLAAALRMGEHEADHHGGGGGLRRGAQGGAAGARQAVDREVGGRFHGRDRGGVAGAVAAGGEVQRGVLHAVGGGGDRVGDAGVGGDHPAAAGGELGHHRQGVRGHVHQRRRLRPPRRREPAPQGHHGGHARGGQALRAPAAAGEAHRHRDAHRWHPPGQRRRRSAAALIEGFLISLIISGTGR